MARGVSRGLLAAACVALAVLASCGRKAADSSQPASSADSAATRTAPAPDTSSVFATWALRQHNTRDSQVRDWPMVAKRQGVWTLVDDCVCQPQGVALPIGDEAGRMVLWRLYCRETNALVVVGSTVRGDSAIQIRGVQEFSPADTVTVQAVLVDRRRRIARWVFPQPGGKPDTLYCAHVSAVHALPRDAIVCGDQSDIQ